MYQNIVINFACTYCGSLNQIFVKFKQLEKENHYSKGKNSIDLIKPIFSSKKAYFNPYNLYFLPIYKNRAKNHQN